MLNLCAPRFFKDLGVLNPRDAGSFRNFCVWGGASKRGRKLKVASLPVGKLLKSGGIGLILTGKNCLAS
jgi:hypothetical protein